MCDNLKSRLCAIDYYRLINCALVVLGLSYVVYRLSIPDSVHEYFDTKSYFDAWEVIKAGKLDALRTPVYPVLIGVLSDLLGYKIAVYVVWAIQWGVFYVSVRYFRAICELFVRSKALCVISVMIYAFSRGSIVYNCGLVTESLAHSGLVFMVYCAIKFYRQKTYRMAGWITLWLFFEIYLRPIFVFMIPVTALYLIGMLFKSENKVRKLVLTALAGVVVCAVSLVLYAVKMKDRYGAPAITYVSYINFLSEIEIECGESVIDDDMDWEDIYLTYKDYRSKYGDDIPLFVKDNFVKSLTYPIIPGRKMSERLTPKLWMLYFVIFVFLISLFFRKNERYRPEWFLLSVIISNIIVAIVGAHDEWGRLTYPSQWIALLMIAMLVDRYYFLPVRIFSMRGQ